MERLLRRLIKSSRRVEAAVRENADRSERLINSLDRLVRVLDPDYMAPDFSDGGSPSEEGTELSGSEYEIGSEELADVEEDQQAWKRLMRK
jgi:hypothetical protein